MGIEIKAGLVFYDNNGTMWTNKCHVVSIVDDGACGPVVLYKYWRRRWQRWEYSAERINGIEYSFEIGLFVLKKKPRPKPVAVNRPKPIGFNSGFGAV